MVLHKTVDGIVSCAHWDALATTFLGEGRNRYTVAYVVFTDGVDTFAQNGITGAIDYGGPADNGTVDGGDADAVWQAALNNTGAVDGETKIVDGCGMSYSINTTLSIPSNVWLVNARFSLINASNTHMIESYGFATHTGLNHWYVDTESVPYNIGLVNVHLYGNKGNQASGYGVRFYAKRYYVKNVFIRNIKQVGFYSECGDVTGQHDWRDIPTSLIDGLFITASDGIGFQFRGPHDSVIRHLEPSQNGGIGASFESSAGVYLGHCFIEFIHSYTNTGIGINIASTLYAQTLIGETHTGTDGINISANSTVINKARAHSGGRGIVISSHRCHISEITSYNHTGLNVEITGHGNQIGLMTVEDGTTGGVLISGNYNQIDNLQGQTFAATYLCRITGTSNKICFVECQALTVQDGVQIDGNGNQVLGGHIAATGDVITLGVTALVRFCYVKIQDLTGGYTNLINYFAGSTNNEVHAWANTAGAEVLIATTNPGITDYFDCAQIGANPGRTRNRGTATFSGDGATTAFNIAHGCFAAPTHVTLEATTAGAVGDKHWAVVAANIVVTFITAPPTGANNVVINWEAIV